MKLLASSLSLILTIFFVFSCHDAEQKKSPQISLTGEYLNHSDSAKYVGMSTCKSCHQDIYNSFIRTGMGKSFDVASKNKSAANFSKAEVNDPIADYQYKAFWLKDSLYMKEYRLSHKDTVHNRTEKVNYIIGSGQHTNSHLQVVNGYLCQMPMTWYAQKKKWDLPPGFENGVNTRFSRKIGLECMSCHNAYPDFVEGSENKYKSVPSGINCERCHGPGSIHVAERMTGTRIDTAKEIDYSIVNPAKLPIDRQFDVCQRCHLQGNAVLKEGKSFYDFKPGQKLSDYISVFLPRYKNADDEFIMASHADRLKQSACFISSHEKNKNGAALRPGANALTCITCHNPHVSVKETNANVFNEACINCHGNNKAKEEIVRLHPVTKIKSTDNCVGCHMPLSGATDIPHVTVHDHFIRKPITKIEKEKIKTFLGLYAINEKNPEAMTRAKAYVDQYDKFDHLSEYLDSAATILNTIKEPEKKLHLVLQLNFIKGDYKASLNAVNGIGELRCEQLIGKKSFDNRDAWSAYRIAEANAQSGNSKNALKWFQKACELAPFNLDFRNKLGTAFATLNEMGKAAEQFEYMIQEDPRIVSAYANLGYIRLVQGMSAEAIRLYTIGLNLDGDNEALLLNLSAYYLFMKDNLKAIKYLEHLLIKHPSNQQARAALSALKKSHA